MTKAPRVRSTLNLTFGQGWRIGLLAESRFPLYFFSLSYYFTAYSAKRWNAKVNVVLCSVDNAYHAIITTIRLQIIISREYNAATNVIFPVFVEYRLRFFGKVRKKYPRQGNPDAGERIYNFIVIYFNDFIRFDLFRCAGFSRNPQSFPWEFSSKYFVFGWVTNFPRVAIHFLSF